MVQDTIVSEYENMLEKGEQIMQVYESRRFIILLENLPVIIFALGWFYFYDHYLYLKIFIFLYEILDKDIFF
ncbi:MAG: hypothetical protein HY919_04030 [Elusimicrobia bacterium]|nr:hypothetical protein [Elusimicrobiota bacterium]